MRGVTPKVAGNPTLPRWRDGSLHSDVMNNATAAQIAAIRSQLPAMFPGGAPVPIFTYTFDPPLGAAGCISALSSPCNIRDGWSHPYRAVAPTGHHQQQVRLVELNGRGRRNNPNK